MKKFLVLDCETATLPFIKGMELSAKQKQDIAIAKPLIYDLGWVISDEAGRILKKCSYLVQETFFVPSVFNTAYYRDKRPIYMEKLKNGKIAAKLWQDIADELFDDCCAVDMVCAYNAMFDFVKAIPFTERYFAALYSDNYNAWEYGQRKAAERIAKGEKRKPAESPDMMNFVFRGCKFPMCDLWAIACKFLVNGFTYKKTCADFPLLTNSGRYFSTSAETVFRYLDNDYDFNEEHTALSDAEIETKILHSAIEQGFEIEQGLTAFPFRELGTTTDFVVKAAKNHAVGVDTIKNVLSVMTAYCDTVDNIFTNTYARGLFSEIRELENTCFTVFNEPIEIYCPDYEAMCEIERKKRILKRTTKTDLIAELKAEIADLQDEVLRIHEQKQIAKAENEIQQTEKKIEKQIILVPRKRDLTAAAMEKLAQEFGENAVEWYRKTCAKNECFKKSKNGIFYKTVNYKEVRKEFLKHFFNA